VRLGWSSVRVAGSSTCLSLQSGHYSSLTATKLQHTSNQERNDQCGNQQHSRELLMMGTVVPETCWASKKYNKITNGIWLVFYLQLSQWCTVRHTSDFHESLELNYFLVHFAVKTSYFGETFIRSNYIDITKATYIGIYTLTDIGENCFFDFWRMRTVMPLLIIKFLLKLAEMFSSSKDDTCT